MSRLFCNASGDSSRGRVKTAWTYRVGSSSRSRALSQRRRALPWHLGQMPVPARVVGDGGRMSAAGATVAMPAERGRAASHDGQQNLPVLPVDPPAAAFHKCLSSTANNVGHLHERPVVQLCLCPPWEENLSASSGLAVALR